MNPTQLFAASAAQAQKVIDAVTSDQLELPTPCTDWDVRGLIGHMVGGVSIISAAIDGVELDFSQDFVGADPAASFAAAAAAAAEALGREGMAEREIQLPWGAMTGDATARLMASDEFVHAWDLAVATGQDRHFDPQLAEGFLAGLREMLTPEWRGGPFGPEVPTSEDAHPADRLAAFTGRRIP